MNRTAGCPPLNAARSSTISAGGRGAYERDRRIGSDAAPLETLLCPAFTTATARESLDRLCERREVLFGRRDTSHADAEYLRPDGRLDIEKITERLDELPWNEEYAEDLGLWAGRRYEHSSGDRERAVLLLTAYQAMHVAYPSPALPVVRDILPVLRTVAGSPGRRSAATATSTPGCGTRSSGRGCRTSTRRTSSRRRKA